MGKYLLIFGLIIEFSFASFSQVDPFKNDDSLKMALTFKVRKRKSPYPVYLSADKLNPAYLRQLYIGYENPLTISVLGVKPENVIVKIDKGSITGENGKYLAVVNYNMQEGFYEEPNGPATITISIKKEDGTVIKLMEEKFDRVPPPGVVPSIGGRKSKWKMTKNFLLSQKIIEIEQDTFPFYDGKSLTVTGFRLICAENSKTLYRERRIGGASSFSNVITDEMIALFKKLNTGNWILFDNITYVIQRGPNKGKVINVQPMIFQIEE